MPSYEQESPDSDDYYESEEDEEKEERKMSAKVRGSSSFYVSSLHAQSFRFDDSMMVDSQMNNPEAEVAE